MNCDWLKTSIKYDCVPVKNKYGEHGIEIGTPFSYADGTAIVIYSIEQSDSKLLFSDNGEALAHLSSVGIKINRVQQVRDIVEKHGLSLDDDGNIKVLSNAANSAFFFAKFISGLLSLADWERERIGINEDTKNLADEAELYLKAWKPSAELIRHPKINGQSRKKHEFDFLFDKELIDVIPANATATGASMRKAGDITNSPNLDAGLSMRFIIDDRTDPSKAEIEKQIIGSISRAMLFSQLVNFSTKSQSTH